MSTALAATTSSRVELGTTISLEASETMLSAVAPKATICTATSGTGTLREAASAEMTS